MSHLEEIERAGVHAEERPDVHNPSVREDFAAAGECAKVDLRTGRTCMLIQRHSDSCDFRPAADVNEN